MLPYHCRNRDRRLRRTSVSPGGSAMVATVGWAGASVAVLALMLGPGRPLAAPPIPPSGYPVGLEDLLDVTVWNNAGISRTVPVRPDGKISLPLLDDVQAAGLSPTKLREVLRM